MELPRGDVVFAGTGSLQHRRGWRHVLLHVARNFLSGPESLSRNPAADLQFLRPQNVNGAGGLSLSLNLSATMRSQTPWRRTTPEADFWPAWLSVAQLLDVRDPLGTAASGRDQLSAEEIDAEIAAALKAHAVTRMRTLGVARLSRAAGPICFSHIPKARPLIPPS